MTIRHQTFIGAGGGVDQGRMAALCYGFLIIHDNDTSLYIHTYRQDTSIDAVVFMRRYEVAGQRPGGRRSE